jgi:hypothetical protein
MDGFEYLRGRRWRQWHPAVAHSARAVLLLVGFALSGENLPSLGKVMDLIMLVLTGGRERTVDEYRDLLASGGFQLNKVVPTLAEFAIIEATPD